jgi:SOS response regulatory protein OraA/RecX
MGVEAIDEQGVPRRLRLLVDGRAGKRISYSIVRPSEVRLALAHEDCVRRLASLELEGGLRYARLALAHRAMHSQQLRRALQRHFLESDLIEYIVNDCRLKGWLNDDDWVEQKALHMQKKGKSRMAVHWSLCKAGVSEREFSFDQREALERVISCKYPELLDPSTPYSQRGRALRSLQRRGFCYEDVQEFLQKKGVLRMMEPDV